jgi:septum site-determining protein MinD
VIKELDKVAEFVLLDSAAGLGSEALGCIKSCDDLLIVTNAEMPAVTDALKTVKLAEQMGKNVLGVVLTKTLKKSMDMSIKNIENMLEKPVVAVVPYDKSVREAMTMRDAVVLTHPKSPAAVCYKKLAATMIGREYNEEPESKRNRIIAGILKKLGWK